MAPARTAAHVFLFQTSAYFRGSDQKRRLWPSLTPGLLAVWKHGFPRALGNRKHASLAPGFQPLSPSVPHWLEPPRPRPPAQRRGSVTQVLTFPGV